MPWLWSTFSRCIECETKSQKSNGDRSQPMTLNTLRRRIEPQQASKNDQESIEVPELDRMNKISTKPNIDWSSHVGKCACNQKNQNNSTSCSRSIKTSPTARQAKRTTQTLIFNSKRKTMHNQNKFLSNFASLEAEAKRRKSNHFVTSKCWRMDWKVWTDESCIYHANKRTENLNESI